MGLLHGSHKEARSDALIIPTLQMRKLRVRVVNQLGRKGNVVKILNMNTEPQPSTLRPCLLWKARLAPSQNVLVQSKGVPRWSLIDSH